LIVPESHNDERSAVDGSAYTYVKWAGKAQVEAIDQGLLRRSLLVAKRL